MSRPFTPAEIRAHRLAHMMSKTDRELAMLLGASHVHGPGFFPPELLAIYQADIRAEQARRLEADS